MNDDAIPYFFIAVFLLTSIYCQEEIILGPNSQAYEKIAKGTLTKHSWTSQIFAGTIRDYYIYVPAQYDGKDPAALMVFQDGHTYVKEDGDFRVPTVFDNLIAQQKMPVTIGVFINPGHDVNAPPPESPWRVTNRSVEYDDLSDTYARFLTQEIIPELKKKYHISDDPKMRAICGISSGGICAFTVAWSNPAAFHKVLSHIGSFTDIRGGHNYPSLIHKTENKPIKVFLQDGMNDLDNRFGNWWLANLQMEAALKFKEYDYKFVSDTGAHNGALGGLILPESLIWLWSDVVSQSITSQVYRAGDVHSESLMMSGETMHLSDMEFSAITIGQHAKEKSFHHPNNEQIIILREGHAEVTIHDQTKRLGPNSIVFLLPGDKANFKLISQSTQLYHMNYIAKKPSNISRGRSEGGSFMIEFGELDFRAHDRGGVRNYFRKATAMCPYYEMHVTTLNPGIKSHEPHTHLAEELIIMIEGQTEEEIGNEIFQGTRGDVYFLGANVPHAIKNIGEEPCMYFAFQWN